MQPKRKTAKCDKQALAWGRINGQGGKSMPNCQIAKQQITVKLRKLWH